MSWDFIKITLPKASRPYPCEECRREIAKGEVHSYTAGRCEGELTSYRLCMECHRLAQAYCTEIDSDGFPLGGELRHAITEATGCFDPLAWLAKVDARAAELAAEDERRRKRVASLRGAVICERCGATLETYSDACTAALDDACPGFMAVERALAGAPA